MNEGQTDMLYSGGNLHPNASKATQAKKSTATIIDDGGLIRSAPDTFFPAGNAHQPYR